MIRTLLATTAVAAVLALPVFAQDASSSMMDSSMMDSSMMSSEMPMDSSMMSSEMPMDSSMMSSEMPMDSSMMSSEMPMDSSMMSSEMPMDSSTMSSEMTDSSMMSSEMPMDSSSMMSSEPTGPFDIVTGYTRIDSDRFATRIIGQPVYDSTADDANKLGDITDIVIDEAGNAQAVIIGVGGFLGIGEKQVAVAYSAMSKEMAADNTERYVVSTTVEDLTAAPDFVVVEDDAAAGTVTDDTMAPAADPMAPAPAAQ